jgi:acyl-CoA thioester hydrolase
LPPIETSTYPVELAVPFRIVGMQFTIRPSYDNLSSKKIFPLTGTQTQPFKRKEIVLLDRNRLQQRRTEESERTFQCKVYYEDTDCMSVVYHANYLKYLERARTEYIEERLSSVAEYHRMGYLFMVHKMEIMFHGPARLGDTLEVRTWIENTTRYRVVAKQIIIRKGEPRDYLVTATVTLVAVDEAGKLREIPSEFHEL